MRYLASLFLSLLLVGLVAAQNEQAPITEKPFAYKDWTYKNVRGGGETNLRNFAKGKKLVMVVYWAPWCHNWEHDRDFVQELYQKYGASGLGVIGVGEYDPVGRMKDHFEKFKLTFPTVYETDNSSARLTSAHYQQRTEAGDTRKWGTPWYVFIDPETMKPAGEFLTESTTVVSGELMRADVEAYIQKALGTSDAAAIKKKDEIEACEPTSKVAELKKP